MLGHPLCPQWAQNAEAQWSPTGPGHQQDGYPYPVFQVRRSRQRSWPSRTCGGGSLFLREKQIKSKTRINRVQGSGLWTSASLMVPQASDLGLSTEAAQESEGFRKRDHMSLAGQSVPSSLLF